MFASYHGNVDVVKQLLSSGAAVDMQEKVVSVYYIIHGLVGYYLREACFEI